MRKLLQLVILIFLWVGCEQTLPFVSLTGKTMGTIYNIKCQTSVKNKILQFKVDSLLAEINQSVSAYIPTSTVSQINTATSAKIGEVELDEIFLDNFNLSKTLFKNTNGAFNPALAPLISYWGFGYKNLTKKNVDTNLVRQLKVLCNFNDFDLQQKRILKKENKQQLDFNAIAKGYAVDRVAELLIAKNITNFMVEIGGEIRANGLNVKKQLWTIAIEKPEKNLNNRSINAILKLNNQAVATSGNYRNYRNVGDEEYGHIISPYNGFPKKTDIISATIIAENCAEADAYATACMVLGFENAKKMLSLNSTLMAYFIYKTESGKLATYNTQNLNLLIHKLN